MKVHFSKGEIPNEEGEEVSLLKTPQGKRAQIPRRAAAGAGSVCTRRGGAEERHLEEEDSESGRGTRQKARQGCPAPQGTGQRSGRQRIEPDVEAEGRRAGPGRAALGVPAGTAPGASASSLSSPSQARLAPRRPALTTIPRRPRARFGPLARPGAAGYEACPTPSGCPSLSGRGSPASLRCLRDARSLRRRRRRAALQPPPPSGGAGVTASEPQCRSTPAPAADRPGERPAPSAPISFRRLPALRASASGLWEKKTAA